MCLELSRFTTINRIRISLPLPPYLPLSSSAWLTRTHAVARDCHGGHGLAVPAGWEGRYYRGARGESRGCSRTSCPRASSRGGADNAVLAWLPSGRTMVARRAVAKGRATATPRGDGGSNTLGRSRAALRRAQAEMWSIWAVGLVCLGRIAVLCWYLGEQSRSASHASLRGRRRPVLLQRHVALQGSRFQGSLSTVYSI